MEARTILTGVMFWYCVFVTLILVPQSRSEPDIILPECVCEPCIDEPCTIINKSYPSVTYNKSYPSVTYNVTYVNGEPEWIQEAGKLFENFTYVPHSYNCNWYHNYLASLLWDEGWQAEPMTVTLDTGEVHRIMKVTTYVNYYYEIMPSEYEKFGIRRR